MSVARISAAQTLTLIGRSRRHRPVRIGKIFTENTRDRKKRRWKKFASAKEVWLTVLDKNFSLHNGKLFRWSVMRMLIASIRTLKKHKKEDNSTCLFGWMIRKTFQETMEREIDTLTQCLQTGLIKPRYVCSRPTDTTWKPALKLLVNPIFGRSRSGRRELLILSEKKNK